MATTTDVGTGVAMIALNRIRHDVNVCDLAVEDVDARTGSIALLGQITPAIVRPDGDGYVGESVEDDQAVNVEQDAAAVDGRLEVDEDLEDDLAG